MIDEGFGADIERRRRARRQRHAGIRLDPNVVNGIGAAGYAQWLDTKGSPRRSEFEAFERAHPDLTPDEANTRFLELEIQKKGYAGTLGLLRDPNASLQSQVMAVRKNYERPAEWEANDAARMSNAASVMTGKIGPRMAQSPAEDTELSRALNAQTVGGAISLWSSGNMMNKPFEAMDMVAKSAQSFADTMNKWINMQRSIEHDLGAPSWMTPK